MAASLHVLRKLCSIYVFLCITSYTGTPGNLKSYYIQPGGMTFPKRILCLVHHPGQWIGSQQATQNNGTAEGADGAVFWSGSAHRAPLPRILLANVQSLDNKVDEIRARVAFHRAIRDCNVLCFTETWRTRDTLSEAVQPPVFFKHCTDRNKHLAGKKKDGGVCLMINKSWCDHNNIQELKSFCSPDLEFLTIKCRSHYLPREFS